MTGDQVRAMQRDHIVAFLLRQDFSGRVLDYGCGTAPYRGIVESGRGEWHGYNRGAYPGGSTENIGPDLPLTDQWDVILCTQMLQYVPDPRELLGEFRLASERLVLTVATNWPEVEPEDLYRFTLGGTLRLLRETGWDPKHHERLGAVPFGDREACALGYGVCAT